jgi:hypothetical protein
MLNSSRANQFRFSSTGSESSGKAEIRRVADVIPIRGLEIILIGNERDSAETDRTNQQQRAFTACEMVI